MLRDNVLINAGVQAGILDEQTLHQIKLQARRERTDLLDAICQQYRLTLTDLYRAYAQIQEVLFLGYDDIKLDTSLLMKMSPNVIKQRAMLPLLAVEETPLLLVANPEDKVGIAQIKRQMPPEIEVCMTDPRLMKQLLTQVTQGETVEEEDDFDPVAELNEILREAYLSRASDIHFEPKKESFSLRLRIDGRLQSYIKAFNQEQGLAVMSRMKVLSGMDISEQRMPQDGGMTYQISSEIEFDIRAATVPTKFGERATLRLLGSDSEALSLEKVGFSQKSLTRFAEAIRKPHGIILITGPTGSGKSTTLYSALQEIARKDINVLTVEDPVEYVMPGISQVQVGTKVSFASALRSFLRHDPDVIMVGEIRDGETASIAMKAALTGHMVFSTLHTNSAISTINRLQDIGVEPFLIGSALECIIAQRLVRKLCEHCKVPAQISAKEQAMLNLSDEQVLQVYQAKGCAHCYSSGYKGRIALFETLWVDDALGELIGKGADESIIREHAADFVSLADDCREKILAGATTLDEFYRLALHISVATNHTAVA